MEIIAEYGTVFLILAVVFGLYMTWGIGANDVANAIGAAIAKVSGSAEEVVTYAAKSHSEAVQEIAARAGAVAVAAGADLVVTDLGELSG